MNGPLIRVVSRSRHENSGDISTLLQSHCQTNCILSMHEISPEFLCLVFLNNLNLEFTRS